MLKNESGNNTLKLPKDHYDVALNGLWWAVNYGSQLNGYAVYSILKSLGKDVLLILKPNARTDDWEFNNTQNLHFIKTFYPEENICPSLPVKRLHELNDYCDAFITGSDQLWNYYINKGFERCFFLGFADDDKKKISFGTSFGYDRDITPAEILPSSVEMLSRFNAISVREKSGARICRDIYKVKAKVVTEPVFCIEKKDYLDLASHSSLEEKQPYILTYILDPKDEIREAIKWYEQASGMKVINILDSDPRYYEKNLKTLSLPNTMDKIGAEDFLKLLSESAFVITDSFHGTAFSIIFNKPFLSITNTKRGSSRFSELLENFGLTERLCCDPNNITKDSGLLSGIDYSGINSQISRMREDTLAWLKQMLDMPLRDMPSVKMPENAITTKLNYKMCTGCSACISTCPVSALSMEPDEYGYYKAVLDRDKCTNCGKCTTICPAFNKLNNDNKTLPDCFEFVALEEKKLKSSSSGGAFTVLAEEFISWGGCVAGAAWTEDFRAEHIIIDKAEDIYKLQKSKYLQSDLNDIFLRIEKKLEDNVPVLFSGCPCQVAGLKAFLNKDYDNLLLVDILCSYSPSPMFFRKYLEDSFPGGISAYEFRHKKNISSWDCTTVKITKKDGLETVVNGGGQDDFQRVFHNKIMIPPHCEKCRFQNYPRTGDITLGDFWGIEKHDPQAASKGVSVILSNNIKGQYFLDFISDYKIGVMKKVPLDWIGLNGNRERASFSGIIPKRDMFYDAIKRMSFSGAVNYATKSNHGIYKNPGNVSLPPLAFSRRINTFHFDPAVWDMHFINNATVLTVYPKKSAPGNFAVLPLNCTLKNNTTYTLNIRFKVKTESPVLNFHIKDSGSGYWQIIHTFKTAHDSADKWNELKVDFIPRSNIYDEFMIGASQIRGESNFICFDHIFVTEKN